MKYKRVRIKTVEQNIIATVKLKRKFALQLQNNELIEKDLTIQEICIVTNDTNESDAQNG